jgi:hypothetical protein
MDRVSWTQQENDCTLLAQVLNAFEKKWKKDAMMLMGFSSTDA